MNSKVAQKKVDEIVSQFSSEYKSLATEIADFVYKKLNAGIKIDEALSIAFKKFRVEPWMLEKLTNAAVKTVCYGMGIEPTFAMLNDQGLTQRALSMSYSASKVNLSRNVHKNVAESKRIISQVVKNSYKYNQSVQQTALSIFDGYGYGKKIDIDDTAQIHKRLNALSYAEKNRIAKAKLNGVTLEKPEKTLRQIEKIRVYVENMQRTPLQAAYNELLDSISGTSEKAIEKSLYVALQEKARNNAKMIVQTETSRAYGNAFESRSVLDPDVSGIKYSLSTGHAVFDICDMHTSVDFGFGEGVYPLSKIPVYPFHPRCTCRMIEVFKNELPDGTKVSDEQVEKSINTFIDDLHPLDKKKLVGVEAAQSGNYTDNIRNFQGYKKAKAKIKAKEFF